MARKREQEREKSDDKEIFRRLKVSNNKEKYQLICDKVIEKYGLECEVKDLYECEYFIYVKKFDIKCTFKNIHLPIMHCVDHVASYCYKSIPKHYIDLVNIILRGDER